MARGVLQAIQPLHAELKPPEGAVPFGVTPDGKQLYKEVTRRSRAVPDIDPVTGKQRWRKHPTTGDPVYKLNKHKVYDQTRIYFLESGGNGNVMKVDFAPPTPEETAADERAKKVAEMKDTFAEVLVDGNVDPKDLLALVKGGKVESSEEQPTDTAETAEETSTETSDEQVPDADEVPEDSTKYPVKLGGGWYELSNGEKIQGKEDAVIEAELAVLEAKTAAKEAPGF